MIYKNTFSRHVIVIRSIFLIMTVLLAQLVSMPLIQAQSLKVNDISEPEDPFYSTEYFDNKVSIGPEITQSTSLPKVTGYMTGGGSVTNGSMKVTHSFELKCDAGKTPNNLQVTWDKGNKFKLDNLTTASCTDDPAIKPNPPAAGFDTYEGKGTGSYNGVPGASAQWKFTDAGEPGNKDSAKIQI